MVQVRRAGIGRGVDWITAGFRNFMKHPGMWIALTLVLIVAYAVMSVIPLVGGFVAALVSPILFAGLLHAAKDADEGHALEFGSLWRGFQDNRVLNGLLTLGAVVVAGAIVSFLLFFFFVGTAMMAAMYAGDPNALSPLALGTGGLVALLLVLAIQLLVAMVLVYAVPLVTFRATPVGEAMSASLKASAVNLLPLLLFSVIYLLIAVVASLPALLGWLVLFPASVGMLYASYRDVFGA